MAEVPASTCMEIFHDFLMWDRKEDFDHWAKIFGINVELPRDVVYKRLVAIQSVFHLLDETLKSGASSLLTATVDALRLNDIEELKNLNDEAKIKEFICYFIRKGEEGFSFELPPVGEFPPSVARHVKAPPPPVPVKAAMGEAPRVPTKLPAAAEKAPGEPKTSDLDAFFSFVCKPQPAARPSGVSQPVVLSVPANVDAPDNDLRWLMVSSLQVIVRWWQAQYYIQKAEHPDGIKARETEMCARQDGTSRFSFTRAKVDSNVLDASSHNQAGYIKLINQIRNGPLGNAIRKRNGLPIPAEVVGKPVSEADCAECADAGTRKSCRSCLYNSHRELFNSRDKSTPDSDLNVTIQKFVDWRGSSSIESLIEKLSSLSKLRHLLGILQSVYSYVSGLPYAKICSKQVAPRTANTIDEAKQFIRQVHGFIMATSGKYDMWFSS